MMMKDMHFPGCIFSGFLLCDFALILRLPASLSQRSQHSTEVTGILGYQVNNLTLRGNSVCCACDCLNKKCFSINPQMFDHLLVWNSRYGGGCLPNITIDSSKMLLLCIKLK